MSVNVTTYETSLQTKLDATSGSTSTTDFLLLAKAVDALNTGAVITVSNTGSLPTASDNAGRSIYVTGESKMYFSNGSSWVSIQSSADVAAAISAVIDSAPGALDTLNELAAALGDDANFSTTVTNALAAKAPIADPTFTGTVSGISKSMVGLGNVDNTSDANKPISTATQTALDAKAPLDSPTFTGTVSGVTASMVGLGNVTNESKATMFTSPTFTGTTTIAGLKDTRVAVAASDIDLSAGTYFTKTISATTTFTVSNTPSSGSVGAFILDLTNGGSSQVTFMTGIKWAGGTPPTLTSSGRDVLGFFTHDGGTTWNGFVLGKALA